MMTHNATAQKTKDNPPGLDWALAIAYCVSGVSYLWWARPPNTWFFGVPGATFLFYGLFHGLIASIRAATERARQQKGN
jgi:predicted benzoate:H+ symporter BenE